VNVFVIVTVHEKTRMCKYMLVMFDDTRMLPRQQCATTWHHH